MLLSKCSNAAPTTRAGSCLGEMFQIVAAVNDAGVEEGTWTARFVVALTTLP